MSERLAIIGGVRTPFCKAGGPLAGWGADDLGAFAAKEAIARSGVSVDQLDEVIAGNVSQPIDAANVARVITLKTGLPQSLIASTVHRNCASGMEAITTAAAKIAVGEARAVLCVATESMSNIPLYMGKDLTALFARAARAKSAWQRLQPWLGFRPKHLAPIIGVQLGLTDPIVALNMGQTAEIIAREFHVTRREQDEFALMSHQRAVGAQTRLAEEIIPVPVPPGFDAMQAADDGPRPTQDMAALEKLKPYFDRVAGTVTVGNACPITDGGAACVVMAESAARARGLLPLGYLSHWAYAALDPRRMGLGPVFAIAKLVKRGVAKLDDFDLIEINEAFAAQVIACERAAASGDFCRTELGLDGPIGAIGRERLNVNGGAIALGHPVGATGMRLVITLLKELRRRGKRRGLASLCVGGGQGAALVLETE